MTYLVLAGGGTGGHLFPGIALAQRLRRERAGVEPFFVCGDRAVERAILHDEDVKRLHLPTRSAAVLKRHPWSFLRDNVAACHTAARVLRVLQPAAVIGLGGFASVPVCLAAIRQGIPLHLLEQNAVAGRATSLLSRYATAVSTSFPRTGGISSRTRVVVTGTPVRDEIARLVSGDRRNGPPTLLILGGSQGARAINSAMLAALPQLQPVLTNWRLLHQTGESDVQRVREAYAAAGIDADVHAFVSDMTGVYRQATLVVSRAGGTTLAEFACAGLPAVLVPIPDSIRNHQHENALRFADAGGAILVPQSADPQRTASDLTASLQQLIGDPARRLGMSERMRQLARPAAAARILQPWIETPARRAA